VQIPLLSCVFVKSDHLDRPKARIRPPHGKVQKRPALLGEVDGGRSPATTRLYPALFSTVENAWAFCVLSLDGGFLLLPTKPSQLVLVGAVGKLATSSCISPHRGGQGATGWQRRVRAMRLNAPLGFERHSRMGLLPFFLSVFWVKLTPGIFHLRFHQYIPGR